MEDATVEDGVLHAERSGPIEPLDAVRLTLPEPYELLRPLDLHVVQRFSEELGAAIEFSTETVTVYQDAPLA